MNNTIEKNTIINGDSIEIMKRMPDESVDLIFADPPYWMRTTGKMLRTEGTEFDGVDDEWDQFESLEEYEEFTSKWLTECKRIMKKDASIWVIGSMQCIYTIGSVMQELGYWIINDVIWHKKNPTPNFMGTRLNNSHETMIWATKSRKAKYCFHYKTAKELNHDNVTDEEFENGKRKQMGSVWRIGVCQGNERIKDDDGNKLHSTQKPEELLYRIIAISSDEEDTVFDPFGGTFTTAAVAKKLGRYYISCDMDEKYCRYGERRLEAIEYVPNDISKATYDIKPLHVTMQEMIDDDYLHADEQFTMRDIDVDDVKLKANGRLDWNGTEIDMHTCAAKIRDVRAKKINGYDYWYVYRNGEKKNIGEIREEYRKHKKNKKNVSKTENENPD